MNKFWFFQVASSNRWSVADPVAWCLENARQPLLEPAGERLLTLDAHSDPERVVNVVLRRCHLNLLEVPTSEQAVLHYWTDVADPRPLLKELRLARPEVQVAHLRRKNGTIVLRPGDHFRYGEELWDGFGWDRLQQKWERRDQDEADDWSPTVITSYSWEGMTERRIPWTVLKSIWRREAMPCPNCDVPLVLIAFRLDRPLDRLCFSCRRLFQDVCVGYLWTWLVQHMDPALLPAWRHGIDKIDIRPWREEGLLQRVRQRTVEWRRLDQDVWKPWR